jgi:phosphoribosylformylglycinamidine synthase
VSLYNEAPSGPIFPTPVVGIVGALPDVTRAGRLGFVAEGDAIALVGEFEPSLAGSELAKLRGLVPVGPLPAIDGDAARAAHEVVREGVRNGAFRSAHDIAEGGIAVALAECCLAGGIGAVVDVDLDPFAEAPGRAFVVSGPDLDGFNVIGTVGGEALELLGLLRVTLDELREAWENGLAPLLAW